MTKTYPVFVLLLRPPSGDPLFVAGGKPPVIQDSAPRLEPEGRLARIKQVALSAYESLSHRFDHQENTCAHFRHASELQLIHPDTLDWQQALDEFQGFLKRRQGKHRRWRVINLVVALLGGLLTPLPGPNVFFFYPAARLLGHHFALSGIVRANRLGVASVRGDPLLTRLEQCHQTLDEVDAEVKELEEHYRTHQLRRVLETLCSRKSRSS